MVCGLRKKWEASEGVSSRLEEEKEPTKESWWEERVRQWDSQDKRLEAGAQGLLLRGQVINDKGEGNGDLILRPQQL